MLLFYRLSKGPVYIFYLIELSIKKINFNKSDKQLILNLTAKETKGFIGLI
jgi:hypothetical protein